MPLQNEIVIRRFESKDRQAVRDIAYKTAFMGEPASIFIDGKEIICDALTLYFTDYEPDSSFVAEDNGRIVGCLIGAKDKAASEEITGRSIAPRLLWRALFSGFFFSRKNIGLLSRILGSSIKKEFRMPDFNREYPATLHINIAKEYRGLRLGSRLIAAFLDYLKQEGVSGVHLATMSERGGDFFSKQGFKLLHSGKRSYFRNLLHKDLPLYIYARKLDRANNNH